MFSKILIANRGEIACRVIMTARKMGVRTVAVYSQADQNAKHVKMADEAVYIGPSPATESYLRAEAIIQAALQTGAQAIHPGYGFLSENPDFVRMAEQAGLVFIGPSAEAIKAMGLKDAAKALMIKAGVPVVPGYHGEDQTPEMLAQKAEEIGYPVLIKARAGGGGKGMRLVQNPDAFKEALEAAQREGQASFGDPVCLIEKYITQPRHIEVQVFGDKHGHVVHFFERDCSLQRRHQKVIEEAPAPDMPQAVRDAMGRAAVEAAKAISYCGAGTVEFIVDGSSGIKEDGFWFMEMNTRLQVEHPVTEAITGYDFVELQLRIAAGEPLGVTQEALHINGWAFEARVYAEDVPKGFLPATGTVNYLGFPEHCEFERASVRIDSGITHADEISPYYDPMVAKVIVHGATRKEALTKLSWVLEGCKVGGTVTNIEFLTALSKHPAFAAGQVDTQFIAQNLDELIHKDAPPEFVIALAAMMCVEFEETLCEGADLARQNLTYFRHWTPPAFRVKFHFGAQAFERQVTASGQGHCRVSGGSADQKFVLERVEDRRFRVRCGGTDQVVDLVRQGNDFMIFAQGRLFVFDRPDPMAEASQSQGGGDALIAPMPGLVTKLSVVEGQSVSEGEKLMILEAMKMEHELVAPRDGIIKEVFVAKGDQVTDGALLLQLESADE